jgi:hypothetical protein
MVDQSGMAFETSYYSLKKNIFIFPKEFNNSESSLEYILNSI